MLVDRLQGRHIVKLLCFIDHAAARQRGYTAHHQNLDIDIDLTTLSAVEQSVVDCLLMDPRDISKHGRLPGVDRGYRLELTRPDAEGFREALAELVVLWQSDQAKVRANADAHIRQLMADSANRTVLVQIALHESGQREIGRGQNPTKSQFCTAWVKLPYRIPSNRFSECPDHASPEVLDELLAMNRQISESYRMALDSAFASLEVDYMAKIAALQAKADAKAAEDARIWAEYEPLFQRLPELSREKHAAGYASEAEIRSAIQGLIRIDANYQPTPVQNTDTARTWDSQALLNDLSDDEYKQLLEVRKTAPSDAGVKAARIWNRVPRASAKDKAPYDRNGTGDTPKQDRNAIRVALVTWTRGGVETSVAIPFSVAR